MRLGGLFAIVSILLMIFIAAFLLGPLLHTLYPYEQIDIEAVAQRVGSYSFTFQLIPMFIIGIALTSYFNKKNCPPLPENDKESAPAKNIRPGLLGIALTKGQKILLTISFLVVNSVLIFVLIFTALMFSRIEDVKRGIIVEPPGENFSIKLTKEFRKVQKAVMPIKFDDDNKVSAARYESENRQHYCSIMHLSYPANKIDLNDEESFLTQAKIFIDHLSKKLDGNIEKVEDIKLGDRRGIAAYLSGKLEDHGYYMRIDYLRKNNQFYEISYGSAVQGDLYREDVKKYFDSLTIK